MGLHKVATVMILIIALTHYVEATEPLVYDIRDYGATPNGDIAKALLAAWKDASNSTKPTKIVVSKGTWYLSQVRLEYNKAPLELEVQGIIKANPDVNQLPKRNEEWIMINYVNHFTLSGGGVFDGQGQSAWKMNDCHKRFECTKLPINLSFNFINNSYIHDVTTKDSKNFHVNCISSQNVTFQRFTVSAPGDSPNTDGLHIARVKGVYILDSLIETGDDCVSIGDESAEIYVHNVKCGPGHGISIGSLGWYPNEKDVKGIHVENCTFTGTQNGVRVKTWPSTPWTLQISDLYFENLQMNNVSNPIIIDQEYCPHYQCSLEKPSLIKINGVRVHNVRGTSFAKEAITLKCSGSRPCENVTLQDVDLASSGPDGNVTTVCKNVRPAFSGYVKPGVCSFS